MMKRCFNRSLKKILVFNTQVLQARAIKEFFRIISFLLNFSPIIPNRNSMRKNILLPCLGLCLLTLIFSSCKKVPPPPFQEDLCNELNQLHAHSFTAVNKGEPINISADHMEDASYYWSGPNSFQSYYQDNTVSSSADYFNRGWYYVNITYDDCESKFDSVLVDVKFPQGTPACSVTDNTATFNSALIMGDQTFILFHSARKSGAMALQVIVLMVI
jgi:hypothetical protein